MVSVKTRCAFEDSCIDWKTFVERTLTGGQRHDSSATHRWGRCDYHRVQHS